MYSSLTYTHGKTATSVLSVFAAPAEADTLAQIGQLHRACVWENILLKKMKPSTGSGTPVASTESGPASGGEGVVEVPGALSSAEGTSSAAQDANSTASSSPNFKAVQEVVTNFPLNIVPVFQAAIKLFVHRRSNDVAHRKASTDVATTIARIMTENLRWPDSTDLSSNLTYSTLMMGSTTTLLFDGELVVCTA
jgi:E3 ubiquitin-protein ligase HUWE1